MASTTLDRPGTGRRQTATGVAGERASESVETTSEALVFERESPVAADQLEERLDVLELRVSELRGTLNLHSWMLVLIGASTIIPALGSLL